MVIELLHLFFPFKSYYDNPSPNQCSLQAKENTSQGRDIFSDLIAYEKKAAAYEKELDQGIRTTSHRIEGRKTRLLDLKKGDKQANPSGDSPAKELEALGDDCSELSDDLDSLLLEIKKASDCLANERKHQTETEEELNEITQRVSRSKVTLQNVASSLDSISNSANQIETSQGEIRENLVISQENLDSSREKISISQNHTRHSKLQPSDLYPISKANIPFSTLTKAIHDVANASYVLLRKGFEKCTYENFCYATSKIYTLTLHLFHSLFSNIKGCAKEVGSWAWSFIIGSIPAPVWIALALIATYKAKDMIPPHHIFIVISAIAIYRYFLKDLISKLSFPTTSP